MLAGHGFDPTVDFGMPVCEGEVGAFVVAIGRIILPKAGIHLNREIAVLQSCGAFVEKHQGAAGRWVDDVGSGSTKLVLRVHPFDITVHLSRHGETADALE